MSRKETITLNSIQELLKTSATDISQILGVQFVQFAVQKSLIYERCLQKGISVNSDKIASHNRATKRALEALEELGLVEENSGFYWLSEKTKIVGDKQS